MRGTTDDDRCMALLNPQETYMRSGDRAGRATGRGGGWESEAVAAGTLPQCGNVPLGPARNRTFRTNDHVTGGRAMLGTFTAADVPGDAHCGVVVSVCGRAGVQCVVSRESVPITKAAPNRARIRAEPRSDCCPMLVWCRLGNIFATRNAPGRGRITGRGIAWTLGGSCDRTKGVNRTYGYESIAVLYGSAKIADTFAACLLMCSNVGRSEGTAGMSCTPIAQPSTAGKRHCE